MRRTGYCGDHQKHSLGNEKSALRWDNRRMNERIDCLYDQLAVMTAKCESLHNSTKHLHPHLQPARHVEAVNTSHHAWIPVHPKPHRQTKQPNVKPAQSNHNRLSCPHSTEGATPKNFTHAADVSQTTTSKAGSTDHFLTRCKASRPVATPGKNCVGKKTQATPTLPSLTTANKSEPHKKTEVTLIGASNLRDMSNGCRQSSATVLHITALEPDCRTWPHAPRTWSPKIPTLQSIISAPTTS